MNNCYYY